MGSGGCLGCLAGALIAPARQRLPLAGADLLWRCPERPVIHYGLPLGNVVLEFDFGPL